MPCKICKEYGHYSKTCKNVNNIPLLCFKDCKYIKYNGLLESTFTGWTGTVTGPVNYMCNNEEYKKILQEESNNLTIDIYKLCHSDLEYCEYIKNNRLYSYYGHYCQSYMDAKLYDIQSRSHINISPKSNIYDDEAINSLELWKNTKVRIDKFINIIKEFKIEFEPSTICKDIHSNTICNNGNHNMGGGNPDYLVNENCILDMKVSKYDINLNSLWQMIIYSLQMRECKSFKDINYLMIFNPLKGIIYSIDIKSINKTELNNKIRPMLISSREKIRTVYNNKCLISDNNP